MNFLSFFMLFTCGLTMAKEIDKKEWLDLSLHSGEISSSYSKVITDDRLTLSYDGPHESGLDELIQNQQILMDKIDAIRMKMDYLEKQQRDFLTLISDILTMPAHQKEAQEQTDYQKNLDLMKSQQYATALKSWKRFIGDYPLSDKIPYAYYWMAEVYLSDEKIDPAKECYQKLIDLYPSHPKTPEAYLKIGQLEMKQGHTDKAKALLNALISQHPYTQATYLAKKSLAEHPSEDRPHS